MKDEELRKKIIELEKKKGELIERIKKLNARIRYKNYEKKALEPFLEKTKDVKIGHLRRKKNILEFKIATQAYTPRIEREILKKLREVEKELEKVREVERARRKKKLIEKDIENAEKEIKEIEENLKTIRSELKELYGEQKKRRAAAKAGVKLGGFDDGMATLEEMGIIIEEKKKK